jgi:hypothetical protein
MVIVDIIVFRVITIFIVSASAEFEVMRLPVVGKLFYARVCARRWRFGSR